MSSSGANLLQSTELQEKLDITADIWNHSYVWASVASYVYVTTTYVRVYVRVYTDAVCPVMHARVSCVLVRAGSVLASVLQFFAVLVRQAIAGITFKVLFEVRRHQYISTSANIQWCLEYNSIICVYIHLLFFSHSSILSGVFTSRCILFFQLLSSCTPVVLSPPSSISLNCPPHFHLPPSIMAQLLTGCIYHPKEAPQPQSQGTAGAGLVVHKQAFHTTAKCVGVVSLAEPSQTHRVVEMFISDVQSESTTTSVKLLALVSIGEIGRRRYVGVAMWVGPLGWGTCRKW